MSTETVAEQALKEDLSVSTPFPKAWWGRVLYGLFVTVLPILSFSSIESLKPDWQTGKLPDYVVLFLLPEASLFFFPLLAYSIVCYLLLLLAPTRFSKLFVIRCGIYTGVLLALQYSILVMMYSLDSFAYALILIWIFPFVYLRIYRWAVAKWPARKVNNVLFILIPSALLITTLITRGSIALLVLIALTMAAPFWSFLLAVRGSIWLIKNFETRITFPQGIGLTAWFAAYIIVLRVDILKMYELYAALPPTPPPDCYIATAAAQGHPQFVGSRDVTHANGKSLAQRIHNPFIADFAYLLLKPCECLAQLVLKLIIPEFDSISKKVYMEHY